LAGNKKLQQQYEELKQWSAEPTAISQQTISRFVKTVQDGLMNEGHHRPTHTLHYIDWALGALNVQLRMFNNQLEKRNGD
jgi:hypothetical protein